MTEIIDNKYLNSLKNYEISGSNIAQIKQNSEQPSYDIVLDDRKNNNLFKFTLEIWKTTVGYAPSEWRFDAKDTSTRNFKGIENVITHQGTDETACFGIKFYKDESGNVFLLKVSYPFYTSNTHKDGDLILQLFKFSKNSVDEVEKKLIEPKVEIKFEKAKV
jgi:hypothetical protein